jgi:hypothetical protein
VKRFLTAVVAVVLVAVYAAMFVGFVRWYTDGTRDCSNCAPE